MAFDIDLEIRKGLEDNRSYEKIAKDIFEALKKEQFSITKNERLIQFCLHSGAYLLAFKFFDEWISKGEKIPLGQLIELLSLKISKPEEELLQALFDKAKKENSELEMVSSRIWDAFDSRFSELRKKSYRNLQNLHQNKKLWLKEKLEFFQSQNMFKNEKTIFKQLFKMFPEDLDVVEYAKKFSNRWSSDVITRTRKKRKNIDFLPVKKESKEEKKCFEVIKKDVFKNIQSDPDLAYDFSLLLCFIEKYSEALEVLHFLPSSLELDLYAIQLLNKSSHYFESLEAIEKLKTKYSHDVEMAFSATYLKAEALQGIGHVSHAIQLLKEILKYRPDYRSSRYLIEKWSSL